MGFFMSKKAKVAALSIFSNTLLVLSKAVVGIITGSISVISESVHSGIDLIASVIAYYSVKISSDPCDEKHPYGHGKSESISGLIEAVLIFSAGLIIIIQSIEKIASGSHIEKIEFGIYIMLFSTFMNLIVSKMLFKVAKEEDSLALEADAQHLMTDVYTTLGVFGGLVLIKIFNLPLLDPIIAILIAVFIIRVSIQLTIKAIDPLMDRHLPDAEIEKIKQIICSEPEVKAYHKLRTRKSGPQRHIDFHILVKKSLHIDKAHALTERLEENIKLKLSNSEVVIHVEPSDHHEE